MPRTSPISLDEVASLDTLSLAFGRAARGRGGRGPVEAMRADLHRALPALAEGLRAGTAPLGLFSRFEVRDPKRRLIEAPCFADRVVHHAMMAHMGPVIDKGLIDDTFACRVGKGNLAAARRAQQQQRRWPWWVKVDVRAYFHSVDHGVLLDLLARRFRRPCLLGLCGRVLARRQGPPGLGLPIGALTSQHFGNLYLDGLDRFLSQGLRVPAMLRYMDDVVWWARSRAEAEDSLAAARAYLLQQRGLVLKPSARVGRQADPLPLCGFQVRRGRMGLSRRRRRRLVAALRRAERGFRRGLLSPGALVRWADAALAIGAHADALGWRRRVLSARPPLEVG
jgi:RNA-directed DNA polymerase